AADDAEVDAGVGAWHAGHRQLVAYGRGRASHAQRALVGLRVVVELDRAVGRPVAGVLLRLPAAREQRRVALLRAERQAAGGAAVGGCFIETGHRHDLVQHAGHRAVVDRAMLQRVGQLRADAEARTFDAAT